MLQVENLTKGYGGHLLLDGVSFKINERERIGLVGRNGHGKTTLFRLIVGETLPDAGTIAVPKNYRIGYVQQHLLFSRPTVLEEAMTGLLPAERDHHWKAEKILAGLGFSEDDLSRSPETFSGGYQVRLNLAKVLLNEPDLLLLDEPTNYLDITSIRWIVGFLNSWPRELMVITHDRGFMDQVVTHVMGIHRRKVRKIAGNTEKYYDQIAQEEEIHEKTRINDEKKRKEVELFITRFRAKARLAGLVQSRIKTLAKMEKREKLQEAETMDFAFRYRPFAGRHIIDVRGMRFGYDPDRPLINDLDLQVSAGERICIVGPNGRGKTTLLKLLAGRLAPQQGQIRRAPNQAEGFFEQTNVQSLVDERTVEEEIQAAAPDLTRTQVRNICGQMLFSGDDALKKISVLSGGEKARVMLGKILATPVNVLFLDEPTNHLDMDSCDAMLSALDAFAGTLVMVTHNEMFLHALAQKLVVFQDDGVSVFWGGYQDFLDKGGWTIESGRAKAKRVRPTSTAAAPASGTKRPDRKVLKRQRSQWVAERARALKPLEQQIAAAEKTITDRETEMGYLNDAMMAAAGCQDSERIRELSRLLAACQAAIDAAFVDLETATAAHEALKEEFEQRRKEMET
ncbi:MAG TPA: ABC-F family ATP-binding cassette domain-containing protein [Desulfobacteraceae bacterium]|nr:ABC-F family ATP-binding cassette domain-containing protein [Desulfobacteraceae bacterium]